MGKKPNGSAIETIYSDDLPAPSAAMIAALDGGKEVKVGDRRVEPVDPSTLEAAVIRPREGSELLYVGIPQRAGVVTWNNCARFDRRTIGSHEFVVARPIVGSLTARALVGLERAHGRSGLDIHLSTEPLEAERAELEAAAMIHLPTKTRLLKVKWRLWLGAGVLYRAQRFQPAPPPSPSPPPGPGRAFPRLAIS